MANLVIFRLCGTKACRCECLCRVHPITSLKLEIGAYTLKVLNVFCSLISELFKGHRSKQKLLVTNNHCLSETIFAKNPAEINSCFVVVSNSLRIFPFNILFHQIFCNGNSYI